MLVQPLSGSSPKSNWWSSTRINTEDKCFKGFWFKVVHLKPTSWIVSATLNPSQKTSEKFIFRYYLINNTALQQIVPDSICRFSICSLLILIWFLKILRFFKWTFASTSPFFQQSKSQKPNLNDFHRQKSEWWVHNWQRNVQIDNKRL